MRFASLQLNKQTVLIPEQLSPLQDPLLFHPISHYKSFPLQPINKSFKTDLQLLQVLQGKHLLIDEIPFPLCDIHAHYLNGFIHIEAGLQLKEGNLTCMRCGSKQAFSHFSCARCGEKDCRYCRNCIVMGKVSSCSPLYSASVPFQSKQPPFLLQWKGMLSSGQQEASRAVTHAIKKNEELLVWAVCGSGKTEVLFHGLEEALSQNKTICIATPRTDVVLELFPRLKKAFPSINLSALYGGSSKDTTQFVISTTHQLIRYKNFFDVMIIDEVDAFPYNVDSSLQYAVEKSRKKESSLIYLTATPSKTMIRNFHPIVRIPARFHGFPLPIPSLTWVGNWRKEIKKERLPPILIKWITQQVGDGKPVLLFLPSISLIEKVTPLMNKYVQCESVHSEDEDRVNKVIRFRNNQLPVLLSSTILERGITIPNVSVAVIGAEDDVFTESALVQIAGRAGRSKDFPDGSVRFFHYGKTNEMVSAVRLIKGMNREAEERGWLN
ncbi:DEAD/DEAH box helicase [Pseudalkalibacillus hwajinpoensis]|uniref:DEAD/DEAH box helicase n=1 Tax=Guptibacillus hwajinpoensis TaxID=208199 RepID=A0A4V5PYP8_9BACL|nr:DEAD/DEAH box helicase [Pseudalkalibacillus hwajinpoensis]TKD70988.1 DEAD/DEAH box helicase [Pseudalkalibacillus hwajinpoensis]